MGILKASDREKSEELFKELQKLEAEQENLRKKKIEAVKDAETQKICLNLLVAERLLGDDSYVFGLRSQVEEIRRKACDPENAFKARHREVRKLLEAITDPVREKCVERLRLELYALPKLVNKVVSEDGGGITMKPRVTVLTNRVGIAKVQALVAEGLSTLANMGDRSVAEIERFTDEQIGKIRRVDLTSVEQVNDAIVFQAQEFARNADAKSS